MEERLIWRKDHEHVQMLGGDVDRGLVAAECGRKCRRGKGSLRKGLSCLDKNDYDAAITAFTEALRLDPKNVEAYYNRGRAYGSKTEFDEAISEFTVVIRLDPKYAKAYLGLGVANYAKRKLDKAISNFTEAIRLDPTLAKAYNNRGIVYGMRATTTWPLPTTPRLFGWTRNLPRHISIGSGLRAVGRQGQSGRRFRTGQKTRLQGPMKILFLHGWQSTPGGVKPTYLKDHGHEVLNPALPDDDFDAAVRIAQAEFDQHRPDVVVGSSRGGAVAMNINAGRRRLSCSARRGSDGARPGRSSPARSSCIPMPMTWCRLPTARSWSVTAACPNRP